MPIIVIIVCFDKKLTLQEYLFYVRYNVLTVLLLKIHVRDVTVSLDERFPMFRRILVLLC
jgi:hypothetical protein